jgi:hypothetical protein
MIPDATHPASITVGINSSLFMPSGSHQPETAATRGLQAASSNTVQSKMESRSTAGATELLTDL